MDSKKISLILGAIAIFASFYDAWKYGSYDYFESYSLVEFLAYEDLAVIIFYSIPFIGVTAFLVALKHQLIGVSKWLWVVAGLLSLYFLYVDYSEDGVASLVVYFICNCMYLGAAFFAHQIKYTESHTKKVDPPAKVLKRTYKVPLIFSVLALAPFFLYTCNILLGVDFDLNRLFRRLAPSFWIVFGVVCVGIISLIFVKIKKNDSVARILWAINGLGATIFIIWSVSERLIREQSFITFSASAILFFLAAFLPRKAKNKSDDEVDENTKTISHAKKYKEAINQTLTKPITVISKKSVPQLVKLFVEADGERFSLEAMKGQVSKLSIGCSDTATIFIADPVLEEHHADLYFDGNNWYVIDNSSGRDMKYKPAGTNSNWNSLADNRNQFMLTENADVSLSGCLLTLQMQT